MMKEGKNCCWSKFNHGAFHSFKQGSFNAGDEKALEFMLEKCNKMFEPFNPLESHILLLCACLHMVGHVHHIIECNCCY
jgi:hypothetical protein